WTVSVSAANAQKPKVSTVVAHKSTCAEATSVMAGMYMVDDAAGSWNVPRPEVDHTTPVADPPAMALTLTGSCPHDAASPLTMMTGCSWTKSTISAESGHAGNGAASRVKRNRYSPGSHPFIVRMEPDR